MCRVFLIILLFGFFVVGDSSADGSVCKNDWSKKIQSKIVYDMENCANLEIELGNYYERNSLAIVKAANNKISRISDDTFKSARELTMIDLGENKIEEISVGAFKDQGKLQHLYLEQNKLTRIEVGTFDSLPELKKLWLQNNQLSLIEKGLFDKNLKLKELFLSENQIMAIEPTVFQNLNQAQNISLSRNLCSNENFQNNKFDQNFACFKNYESLKPYLDQIHQLESEKEISNDDKSHYKTENARLKREKNNDIFKFEASLRNCEVDKTLINQENLAAKLKSKESESTQRLDRIRQLESETETCKNDKFAYVTEKNRLNQNLISNLKELTTCKTSLSGCETKKSSINREKSNLAAKLRSKESELTQNLKEKSTCVEENDSKEKALKETSDELSKIRNILSLLSQNENKTIYQVRENLIEQLQSGESKICQESVGDNNVQSDYIETDILINILIVAGIIGLVILILLIAFLKSILKIYQLLDDNKDMKAKLDRLCENHDYEKVD
jgi:Leucine-rich repeat (LRR) protein